MFTLMYYVSYFVNQMTLKLKILF